MMPKKSLSTNNSNEEVPSFLVDGLPTSLASSELSSTLHNSLKTQISGSPYPVMDASRKTSTTSIRTTSRSSNANNSELHNFSTDPAVDTTSSQSVLVNSKRSIEKFERANNQYRVPSTSTSDSMVTPEKVMDPLRKQPLYPYKHPNAFDPRLRRHHLSGDFSQDENQHHSFDSSFGRPASRPSSTADISSDNDFSYERTNIVFDNMVSSKDDADDELYFHQSVPSNKVTQGKNLSERTSSTESPLHQSITSENSSSPLHPDAIVPIAGKENTHSHNSSITSQNSSVSRMVNRANRPLMSTHSRQSSLSWAVNTPEEWSLERVHYWLTLYSFNQSWLDCCTNHDLTGAKFLALANYTNLSKYVDELDFNADSSPSKFIHLLRKTLDKPLSDAGRASSPSLGVMQEHPDPDNASLLSSSDVSLAASPIISPTSVVTENLQLPDLGPTISAPNYPTPGMKKYVAGKSSQESINVLQRPRRKGLNKNRPFSSVEHMSHGSSSPVSSSQNFFKKHSKSNSSESSLFSYIFAGSGGDAETVSRKSSKAESPTSDSSKKGIINKLRSKVNERSKQTESKPRPFAPRHIQLPVSSHSSPVESSSLKKIPEASPQTSNSTARPDRRSPDKALSMLNFVIDRKYQPIPKKTNSDLYVLVTMDNKSFWPCNVGSVASLDDLKALICKDLEILKTDGLSFHLTDFGSEEGEALDDAVLEKLRMFSFYGGSSKLLVKGGVKINQSTTTVNDLTLSATSTRSSFSQSVDANGETHTYPATPQYLLGVTKDPVDYLSFKGTLAAARRKSSLPGGKGLHPFPTISSEVSLPDNASSQSSIPESSASTKVEASGTNESNYPNSFRVIRKESAGEIDFDKRRDSPFQKQQLIAKRDAPPPPPASNSGLSRSNLSLSRRKSMKRKNQGNELSLSKTPSLALSPNLEEGYLSPFTPGQSTTLVPQPYRGSVSPVARTPVSPSGKDPYDSDRVPAPSHNTASAVDTHSTMRRDDSVKSSRTITELERFSENKISFEGAPSLSDEEDESSGDSDDDLWAKVPGKKTSSETLNVAADPRSVPNLETQADSISGSAAMKVRPPAEVVYDNLERFFPNTDLDRPIVDEVSSPLMSPLPETSPMRPKGPLLPQTKPVRPSISRKVSNAEDNHSKTAKNIGHHQRMKTIRVVAREANEARKRLSENANNKKSGGLLRRTSTKMWGQKVVEVTPSQLKGGYVSKIKNSKDEYKEFAWVKGELIGKGTFGKVFLALNVTTGEMMAVKQVRVPRSGVANQQLTEVIDALLSEVETMKDLDHINIVQYLGFEKAGNIHSLFLEYVAGGSVGSCLRMYGRLEEDLIRFLTLQVLRGLAYLHSRGILHRDLKADNLLLELDGSCKISDFGISKRSQNIYANDAEMSMQGTIFWMAPEVIDNVVHNEKQGYSAKIDIWSLGCVVLEMFAGRRPWSNVEAIGAIYKLGKTKLAPPIPEDTLPYVSKDAKDFIEKCFIIDPEKRPTAQELLKHPFCKTEKTFEFNKTKLGQMIKFNEKSKEKVLRLEAKEKENRR